MSTKPSRIELDKEQGITIQLINGPTTQTITIDGTTITMEVKGPAGRSTIVQDARSVTVDCDDFVVKAKTIKCSGSVAAEVASGASHLQLAPARAALAGPIASLSGSAEASLNASAVSIDAAAALALTAAGLVNVTGLGVNVLGPTGVKLEGVLLDFVGIPEFL